MPSFTINLFFITVLLLFGRLVNGRSYCDSHCYCDASRSLHWICRLPKTQNAISIDLDLLPSSLRKLELINIQLKQTGRLIKFKSLVEMKLRNVGLNDLPKNFVQTHLVTLDVSNNNLKKLSSAMLQMNNLQQLDLSRNQLTSIDYLFDHLTSLKQLNLSSNLISRLSEHSFRNLTQLQYLNLKSNRLHHVELGAFYQLNNLVKLILDDNIRLEHLKLGLFALQMRSLHLSQTNLTSIPQSINEHIRELYLDHNQLERLTIGDFEHLTNLNTLHLNSNLIDDIEYDTFGRMTYLVELYLSSNHLLKVPEQLPKLLRILSLSDNLITELDCSKIKHLDQLETIDLSSNHIQHLDLHCLSTFVNLKYLDLSENQLTIVDELFVNLNQLQTLNLSGNELIRLSDRSWLGLDNLKDLQLNNIKQNLSCFNLDNKNYLFSHLPQLTLLNLTSSMHLSDCIFNYDQHLDKINSRKSNKFNRDLIVNYFPSLERLVVKELNLIDKLNLTRLQLNLPQLIELDILNSTLNCDNQNLKKLLNLINEDVKVSIQLINLSKWICSTPKKVKNRLLIDLLIADQTDYHYRKLFLEYSNSLELKRLNKLDFNTLSSIQPKAHQLINLKQHQIKWSKLMSADEQYEEQTQQQIDFKAKNQAFSLFNKPNYYLINVACWTAVVFLVFGLSHIVLSRLQIRTKINNLFRSYHKHARFKHVNYSKQHDDVFIITQCAINDGQSNSEEPLIS